MLEDTVQKHRRKYQERLELNRYEAACELIRLNDINRLLGRIGRSDQITISNLAATYDRATKNERSHA